MSEFANGHPRDRLSPYLDDELQVDERAAVDRHLALCPACRDELEALHRIAEAFADEPVPAMPDDLEVRVLHRLDLASIAPMRRRGFAVPVSIAATIAAVGLVSVLAWKQGRPILPPHEPELGSTVAPAPAQAPAPEGHDAPPPARAMDKLAESKKNEVALDTPAAPQPAIEPRELAKQQTIGERQDDADAAQERSRALGYVAGGAGDAKDTGAPVLGRDARAKPRAAAKADTGVVGGVAGALVAPACASGMLEASDNGRWSVADLPRALDELQTVLRAVGGRLEAFEPGTAGFATVVIPRERYGEWIRAAKIQGVAGLAETFPAGDGGCVRQRITIVRPNS